MFTCPAEPSSFSKFNFVSLNFICRNATTNVESEGGLQTSFILVKKKKNENCYICK